MPMNALALNIDLFLLRRAAIEKPHGIARGKSHRTITNKPRGTFGIFRTYRPLTEVYLGW